VTGSRNKALKPTIRLSIFTHLLLSNLASLLAYGTISSYITSLSALFQSCIINEAHPLYSSVIVNCVFHSFSAYTAIMLNILTIYAVRKTSSLPKPLKTLLLSLAVSDFGVGLLPQPLFIVRMVNPTYFTHITFNVGQIIFTVASFFSVVAISVDRVLAVTFISDIRNL